MLATDQSRPGWLFYPAWAVLSTASILAAGGITLLLLIQSKNMLGGTIQVRGQTRITEDYLGGFMLLLVMGLLVGCLQYLMLRRRLPRMGLWVPLTAGGFLLGLAVRGLPGALQGTLGSTATGTLMAAMMGAIVGLVQWPLLRRRVDRAGWWIVANVIGWGLLGLGAEVLSSDMLIPIIGALLAPGIATAAALWLLLEPA